MSRNVWAKGKRTRYPGVYDLGGGTFGVHVTAVVRGRRRYAQSRVVGDVSSAIAERLRLKRELIEGGEERRRSKRVTVREYAESWLSQKSATVRPSVASLYGQVIVDHISPRLGDLRVEDVRPSDIRDWVSWQLSLPGRLMKGGEQRTTSPETVNGRLRILKSMMKDASEEFGIQDPSRRIGRVKDQRLDNDRRQGLEPEQMQRLLDAAKTEEEWWPLILTLALTGARWGEVTALKWADIDRERLRICIRRSHRSGIIGRPKNGKPRFVPLPQVLLDELDAHKERLEAKKHLGLEDDWVFATISMEGKASMRRTATATKAFARWTRAAGIDRMVSPHDLRRSIIDYMRLSGSDAVVIRRLVGHSSEQLRDRYSTVGDAEAAGEVDKVVAVLGLDVGTDVGTDDL